MSENPYKECAGRCLNDLTCDCMVHAIWQEGRDSVQLKWRPIPDEAPEDGHYWAMVNGTASYVGVRMTHFGPVAQGLAYSPMLWPAWRDAARKYSGRIAGPIDPPGGSDG